MSQKGFLLQLFGTYIIRAHVKLLISCFPDACHVLPVGNDAVFDRILDMKKSPKFLCSLADELPFYRTSHNLDMFGSSHTIPELARCERAERRVHTSWGRYIAEYSRLQSPPSEFLSPIPHSVPLLFHPSHLTLSITTGWLVRVSIPSQIILVALPRINFPMRKTKTTDRSSLLLWFLDQTGIFPGIAS